MSGAAAVSLHIEGGNCFRFVYDCRECRRRAGDPCLTCHAHDTDRGECPYCPLCPACEREVVLGLEPEAPP